MRFWAAVAFCCVLSQGVGSLVGCEAHMPGGPGDLQVDDIPRGIVVCSACAALRASLASIFKDVDAFSEIVGAVEQVVPRVGFLIEEGLYGRLVVDARRWHCECDP